MRTKTKLRKFIQAIVDYSEGKAPEGLRVFIIDCKHRRIREVIDIQKLY